MVQTREPDEARTWWFAGGRRGDEVVASRCFFRSMTPDVDGRPKVGRSRRCLGVVPEDVRLRPDGWLDPGSGGMSVAPDSIENLPNHRRPRAWGRGSVGPDGDRIYSISREEVEAAGLLVRLDTEVHGLVEPVSPVPLAAYEGSMESTRFDWETAWPA
jgi:hypothetical protein